MHVQPFVVFQVEHIIVKPEMETVFIRLFPGAVVKGQKVGVNFCRILLNIAVFSVYSLILIIHIA